MRKSLPSYRMPIAAPPTQQEVEEARDFCLDLLDNMVGLFFHSKLMSDSSKSESVARMRPFWAIAAQESFQEFYQQDWDERVRRWGLYFDRFTDGVLTVGSSSYANAFLAIIGVVQEFITRTEEARDKLIVIGTKPLNKQNASTLAKIAREIWNAGMETMGEDFCGVYSRLQAELRVQSARAVKATEQSPPLTGLTLTFEEKSIVDALRKKGKRLTQENVLRLARLKNHGTNKATLAQMVQRGTLTRGTDDRGRGYGLPEWQADKT